MSKTYKQKKSLKLKNLKKRKTIKLRGGAGNNVESNKIKTIEHLNTQLKKINTKTINNIKSRKYNVPLNFNENRAKKELNTYNNINISNTSFLDNITTNINKENIEKKQIYDNLELEISSLFDNTNSKFELLKKEFNITYDKKKNSFFINIDFKTIKFMFNLTNIIMTLYDIPNNKYNLLTSNFIDSTSKKTLNTFIALKDKQYYNEYSYDMIKLCISQLHRFFYENKNFNYKYLEFINNFEVNYYTKINQSVFDKYNSFCNEYKEFMYLYLKLKEDQFTVEYTQILDIHNNKIISNKVDAISFIIKTMKMMKKEVLQNLLNILLFKKLKQDVSQKVKFITLNSEIEDFQKEIKFKSSKEINDLMTTDLNDIEIKFANTDYETKCISRIKLILKYLNNLNEGGSGTKSKNTSKTRTMVGLPS